MNWPGFPDLASTRFRIHSVFKNFHSGERIQKVADSFAGFTGYVWTEAVSRKRLVCYTAVFTVVTQERCVTTLKTAV